ncbi:unnamed protein product [Amoebophrya sp. A25]|nr:unnamed protein product [Amoebophrya sp. A25]|eukprot:GSA25T00027237001.1
MIPPRAPALADLCGDNRVLQDALALGFSAGVAMYSSPTEVGGFAAVAGSSPPASKPDLKKSTASGNRNYALTPHPFPKGIYDYLYTRGTPLNQQLLDMLCFDPEKFLFPVLEKSGVAANDEITGNLIHIARRVYGAARKYRNELRMFICRNDFMLDSDFTAKQVELNTMAASFGGMSEAVEELQGTFVTRLQARSASARSSFLSVLTEGDQNARDEAAVDNSESTTVVEEISAAFHKAEVAQKVKTTRKGSSASSGGRAGHSSITTGFGRAFADLRSLYAETYCPDEKRFQLGVLFVADEDERNEMDHRKMERGILRESGMLCIRRSFQALESDLQSGTLVLENGSNALYHYFDDGLGSTEEETGGGAMKNAGLDWNGRDPQGTEIVGIYFRSGYWPGHLHKPEEENAGAAPMSGYWPVRYFLEKSRAAKVPSALGQLVGMKKIQQLLSENTPSSSSTSANVFEKAGIEPERAKDMELARKELEPYFAEQFDPFEEMLTTRKRDRREIDLLRQMITAFCSWYERRKADLLQKDSSTTSRRSPPASPARSRHEPSSQPGKKEGLQREDHNSFEKTFPDAYATLVSFFPLLSKPLLYPQAYVMKSQIEGSGAVIFDIEMQDILIEALRQHYLIEQEQASPSTSTSKNGRLTSRTGETEAVGDQEKKKEEILQAARNLAQYIIMRKIDAPSFPSAVVVRDAAGEAVLQYRDAAVGEIGFYSCFVGGPGGVVRANRCYGHLLRSKGVDTKQGGVFMGNAVIDAPLLV